jgi:hypothetical protein
LISNDDFGGGGEEGKGNFDSSLSSVVASVSSFTMQIRTYQRQ